nr:retrovirus-related Pol polyprotein from transposon TNT 1-94 [Tanacetum cinerariifolium]
MWNDLILAHEGPSDTRDTKIAALRLRFNAFKALEGKKVQGTFTRLKILLNGIDNKGVFIPQAEDNDSDVKEDTKSSVEFLANLNAEFHDRALLANQKRIYKRSRRVRDYILKGDIELYFVPTDLQLADIFTKQLAEPSFTRLVTELGMLNIDKSGMLQLTSKLYGFQLSHDELSFKVASLESESDVLADQVSTSSSESAFVLFKSCVEAMQDEKATVLGNRVAKLDAQLLEMAAHFDEEFYPRFLTTIFRRQWILTHGLKLDGLKAGVDHGKAGNDLSVIEAYDPFAEAKYINIVNAFGTVDFSLLSELRSKKDASMLMLPVYRPKDNVVLGDTSLSFSLQVVHSRVQRVRGEIKEKRLSLTNVIVPLAEPLSSKNLIGEASSFATPATTEPITTLSMNFASFDVGPSISISNDQILDTEPHVEDPHAVTFEKEELDTSPE